MIVTLAMSTFKPIRTPENASRFLEILGEVGGIYVPEFVGEASRYEPGRFQPLQSAWVEKRGLQLRRRHPLEVEIIIGVTPERQRGVVPNNLLVSIDARHFTSVDRLRELVVLGKKIYNFLSPCYGFVQLPWLPELAAVFRPDLGLPGWGWVTWLGPEYDELVRLAPVDGLDTESMPDGGRLFVCGWPNDASVLDEYCRQTHENVVRRLDPDLLQTRSARGRHVTRGSKEELFTGVALHILRGEVSETRSPKLPQYRYRDNQSTAAGAGGSAVSMTRIGFEEFTRTPEVRAILDKREPESTHGFPNDGAGGMIRFEELTAEEAKRLLDMLPAEQANTGQDHSPTFREMVALGERHPRIRFSGYRIVPERPDERISIDGFYLPAEDATPDVVAEIEAYHPDELEWEGREGRTFLRAWWD